MEVYAWRRWSLDCFGGVGEGCGVDGGGEPRRGCFVSWSTRWEDLVPSMVLSGWVESVILSCADLNVARLISGVLDSHVSMYATTCGVSRL